MLEGVEQVTDSGILQLSAYVLQGFLAHELLSRREERGGADETGEVKTKNELGKQRFVEADYDMAAVRSCVIVVSSIMNERIARMDW